MFMLMMMLMMMMMTVLLVVTKKWISNCGTGVGTIHGTGIRG
jgi:hypothetical protein